MNLPYLRMEIIRMLRNRKVLVLSVIMPAILLLIFGGVGRGQRLGGVDGAAYAMVGMALFGSMSAAVNNGGTIAVERGLGWNRQLRLTPLRPGWYATSKVIVSMVLALPPLLVAYLIGRSSSACGWARPPGSRCWPARGCPRCRSPRSAWSSGTWCARRACRRSAACCTW
jgi:ABC-2 type transport system permease protein